MTLPNVRQVNGRDHRLRPDLDGGVLPGQQVMVRCKNSVKVDDFLNSLISGGRVNEHGRAAHGSSRSEVLTRRSAIPSGSNSGALICK